MILFVISASFLFFQWSCISLRWPLDRSCKHRHVAEQVMGIPCPYNCVSWAVSWHAHIGQTSLLHTFLVYLVFDLSNQPGQHTGIAF